MPLRKKSDGLTQSVVNLRKTSNKIFDVLEDHSKQLSELQAYKDESERHRAEMEMRLRNLEIQFRSSRGEKHVSLAREYGLTEGRISQIANKK